MYDFLDKIGLQSVLDYVKNKCALRSKYGDTTINVGRMAGTDIGDYSTAEGRNTIARGNISHAEGGITLANGECSHAEGLGTIANGKCSHAEGNGTIANNEAESACGKYNESNSDTLFSIGDGTADDARHNAFEITTDGGKLHDKDIATMNNISNPNLLINPDFGINQRAVSGEFSDVGKYFVDRWKLVSGTVTVNTDGTITLNGTISQTLENAVGTNVTASVSAGTAVYDNTAKTFTITGDGNIISWAKLEYGNSATPFVAPDPATEMMKCCRYFQMIDNGTPAFGIVTDSTRIRMVYNVICPMRKNPTVTLLQHTGNFTWSLIIKNSNVSSSYTITDFSTMSATFIRFDGTIINVYINVPHTLSNGEIVYTSGSGGIYFALDAEIY